MKITKLFVQIFIINFLLHCTTQMMNTLTPKYANALGASSATVGFVAGLFAATALIFKMVSAPAIDTFNRKYILLGSIAVMFISFICYSLAYTVPMVMAARLLQGSAQAFTTTCCLTIASDSIDKEKMASGIGYFSLATALAQAIAPTIGLSLIQSIGYRYTFVILAGVVFGAILIATTIKMEHTPQKKFSINIKSMIAKECIPAALILFILSATYCAINAFLILYAESRGVDANIGYFFTIYAVVMLLTRPLIGTLADKWGTTRILIPSFVLFAVGFIIISYSNTIWMFYVAAFFAAFGYGGCQPTVQAVCMRSVPKSRHGAASCTNYIGQDLGHLVGGVFAGMVVDTFGYINMWRILTIPILIAILLTVFFHNQFDYTGERQ